MTDILELNETLDYTYSVQVLSDARNCVLGALKIHEKSRLTRNCTSQRLRLSLILRQITYVSGSKYCGIMYVTRLC